MSGLVIVGVIVIFLLIIVIRSIKMSHIKELDRRATQSLRNNAIVRATNDKVADSDAMISIKNNTLFSKKVTQKFIEDFPNYTSESISKYFTEIVSNMLQEKEMDCFTGAVATKVRKGKGLSKVKEGEVKEGEVKEGFLLSYSHNRYAAKVIVWTKSDEYIVTIFGTVNSIGFEKVDNYSIQKGVAIGLK